jgi:hypothetical protein
MGWFGHPIFPHGVAGHPSLAMGGGQGPVVGGAFKITIQLYMIIIKF